MRRPGWRRHRADERSRGVSGPAVRRAGRRVPGVGSVPVPGDLGRPDCRGAAAGWQAATPSCPLVRTRRPGRSWAGWTMIEVFDTAAARIALARPQAGLPGAATSRCGRGGHARERTIRDNRGGELLTVRPDRAMCTGCGATHVVPRRRAAAASRLHDRPDRGRAPGRVPPLGHGQPAHHPWTLAVPGRQPCAAGSAGCPAAPPTQLARPPGIRTVLASGHDELAGPGPALTSWAARWSTWRPRRW